MKTIGQMYRKASIPGLVGIEIEVEGKGLPGVRQNRALALWTSKGDGSLRGEAVEYVLKRPIKADEVKEQLELLSKYFEKRGAYFIDSDRCGIHVHLNCIDEGYEDVLKFLVAYFCLENILTRYCGEGRDNNLFCLRASDAGALIAMLSLSIKEGSFRYVMGDNNRYSAINIGALHKFGSLEFRALKTPIKNHNLDVDRIYKWVDTLVYIKEMSRGFDSPSNIIEMISLDGHANFIDNMIPYKEFKYNQEDMIFDLLAGVREVQNIAYEWEMVKNNIKIREDEEKKEMNLEGRLMEAWREMQAGGVQPGGIPGRHWLIEDEAAVLEEVDEPEDDF